MRNEMHTPPRQTELARRHPDSSRRCRILFGLTIAVLATSCSDRPEATAPNVDAPSTSRLGESVPTRYDIRDLTPDLRRAGFDGAFSVAFDIDDEDRIAGAASVPGGYQQGFLWMNGQVTTLRALRTLPSPCIGLTCSVGTVSPVTPHFSAHSGSGPSEALCDSSYRVTGRNATRNLFALHKP